MQSFGIAPRYNFVIFVIRGFTLAELLIVLAVIGIAAALLTPSLDAIIGGNADDRAFRMISGAVQRAQDMAVTTRLPQTIALDLDAMNLSIGASPAVPLPSGVRISVKTDREGLDISAGLAEVSVDKYGAIEPFTIRVGDAIVARANPITGVLEQ